MEKEKIKVLHKSFFKSKLHMVVSLIIFCFLIYLFIVIGTTDFSNDIPDNERFAADYSLVGKDNVFKYITVVDAHMIASGKKGIIFFGNKDNEWCQYYADIVNEAAHDVGLEEISYYDFFNDRSQNNATYEDILNLLKDYVTYDDEGRAEMYAPTLLVVSDDKVILYDDETTFMKGNIKASDYWNSIERLNKITELRQAFGKYLES